MNKLHILDLCQNNKKNENKSNETREQTTNKVQYIATHSPPLTFCDSFKYFAVILNNQLTCLNQRNLLKEAL